jgi:hypothetical protein
MSRNKFGQVSPLNKLKMKIIVYLTTLSISRLHSANDRMTNECGAVDGMRTNKGNRNTRGTRAQEPIRSSQIPHGLTEDRSSVPFQVACSLTVIEVNITLTIFYRIFIALSQTWNVILQIFNDAFQMHRLCCIGW